MKDKHLKKVNSYILTIASKDNYITISTDLSASSKKYKKSFLDLGRRIKKERTDALFNHTKLFIDNQCPQLTTNQLLGYLLCWENIQSNKSCASVGHKILHETLDDSDSFLSLEVIALMHSLTLSLEQTRKTRYLLVSKGI